MSVITLDVLDALEYEVLWNFIDFFSVNTRFENGVDHLKLTERGLDSIWDDFGYWRRFGGADRCVILKLMEEPFEISKNDKIYNSRDFLELANNVNALKQNLGELTKAEIERKFKQMLNKLVDMEMKAVTGDIYYRLKGLRAVRERYNDYLYPKQRKIFEFMLKKVAIQGRWKNLNQAVESVLPELDSVLKDFDKTWISQKLEEKTEALKQAVQAFEEYKANPPEREFYQPKLRDKTIENWIRGLRMECETFKKASLADDPSLILKNKLAYNTLYQPESIKNLLKKHPKIVEQIVVKNKKS